MKFRANDLRALIGNWQTFEQILKQINEQASPDNTAKLLQTGLESFNTELQKLTASLQVLGISLSEGTLPALKDMVIGLTEGVQWLNNHKEAANNVISVLRTMIELLIVYKTHQFIANSALGDFVKNMWLEIRTAPSVTAGIQGMGAAFMGLARTIGIAALQLAAFQAAARVISGASADTDEKAFLASIEGKEDLTPMEQEAKAAIDNRNAFIDENAVINGDNDFTGKWALYSNGTTQDESNRLDNVVRSKVGAVNGLKDINSMVDEATKAIAAKGAPGSVEYPSVPGQEINVPKGGAGGAGGSGSNSGSPSSSTKPQRDALKMQQEADFYKLKIASDAYASSLDNLKTLEDIYGKTVASSNEELDLKHKRSIELAKQADEYTVKHDNLAKDIDVTIGETPELLDAVGVSQEQWNNKTKEEKNELRSVNKELLQQNALIKAKFEVMLKYGEKASELQKDSLKIANEVFKEKLGDTLNPEKQSSRNLELISLDESIEKNKVNQANPLAFRLTSDIEITAEQKRLDEYVKIADRLKKEREKLLSADFVKKEKEGQQSIIDNPNSTKDQIALAKAYLIQLEKNDTAEIQKNTLAIQKNESQRVASEKKIADIKKQTTQDIKKWEADSFIDMAQNGKKFKDIMKEVWNGIARDAIYALLGVENQSKSIGTKIFSGKGGKSSGGAVAPTGKKGVGKAATGGVVNTPTIAGEDGEEVVIPVEKNKDNSKNLLQYASNKLGTNVGSSGGTYVPTFKNQTLATQPVVNVSVQKDNESIAHLKESNALMTAMLNHMINTAGNSGNTTIVATQVSSDQVIQILQQNPAALQNILGKNKSTGWR